MSSGIERAPFRLSLRGGEVVELRTLLVLFGCALAMWLHQSTRWTWFIDDAAICFAYARNLVEGHGLVPYPGGERVEGYSDPLYIALLAAFHAFGLDGFTVAKPLGLVFAAATGWLTWRLARRALPEHTARQGPGALVAPIALAASAQFAIWSASGLENGLFCLLLTAGLVRTLEEVDAHGQRGAAVFPWSAVLFLLLAWTRPEGLLYAAPSGAVFAWGTFTRTRDWRPTLRWGVALAVPYAASEALRLWYFAWPLPNTYYAKTMIGLYPFDWTTRGWTQLREWAARLWHGYLVPVYLLGVIGASSGRRVQAGALALGLVAATLLWTDAPPWFLLVRVWLFLAAGALLPLLGFGAPGGLARLLCGWSTFVGLWFLVYANGDWMGAYRFVSLVSPPMSVLFAVGLTQLADGLEERVSGRTVWGEAGWLVAAVGVGLLIPPNLWQTRDHVYYSINETPASVKQRADYTRSIQRRTFWEEPVVNLEIDQGAHLWFNPDYRSVDLAMLLDVPLAHHWYQQRAFVREYIFQEHPPTFGHVGGWWGDYTGLRRYPEWERTMFELPGYENRLVPPLGWFGNVFARRSLVMAERWSQPEARRVEFDWQIELNGWEQPAPWTPGGQGYLEAPFRVTQARVEGQDVQVIAFLAQDGSVLASFGLPMGYGFFPMHLWRVGEVFRGRHAVAVPHSLAPGTYDLGFVLTGPRGRVIPALVVPEGATVADPVFAAGEVRFPAAITVVEPAELDARQRAVRAAFDRQVAAGTCEQAERTWIRFKQHRPEDWTFHAVELPSFAEPLATCWAGRAEHEPDRAVDWLARAHRWDPNSEALERVGTPLAERLIAAGRAAREAERWDETYEQLASVLRFQPWRSWVRRWAEEARDARLGLVGETRIGNGGENDRRALEERTAP
jgi:hypothetical protein